MTGNPKSQYQYWLNRRLGNFEIINKGYGSDTTDRMLARFNRDVLGTFCHYCIIQGGTNDIYWSMAENNGDQATLDRYMETMKSNMTEMIKRCWDNGIIPVIGTLIPRTGATGIYKTALYDYNKWIIEYCISNKDNGKDIYYIDFFNAGKEKFPPTPLEDPENEGALNPIYDGDAIYNEYGEVIKAGRGIHPSPEGYKIMGDCIPLNIFKTDTSGMKIYLDKECTIEEKINSNSSNISYNIEINNIRHGKTKTMVRYLKNIGNNQAIFAMNFANNYNVNMKFVDEENNIISDYASGLLTPTNVAKIVMQFDIQNEDYKASVDLFLSSREIKIN